MMELIQALPAAAPLIGDLLAKNLDWPGADEIAERLHVLLPPQLQHVGAQPDGAAPQGQPGAPGGPPQAPLSPEALQAHAMLAQATQAAQALSQKVQEQGAALQQAQAQLATIEADRSVENRKLDIAQFDAETKRMAAQSNLFREPASATTP
jgi:hypothetical protein